MSMTLANDSADRLDSATMDARTAIEEMKHATAQLDDILQQMCAAKRCASLKSTSVLRYDPQRDDDVFADAREWTASQSTDVVAPSGDPNATESSPEQQQQQTATNSASVERYFEVIERKLAAAVDPNSAIRLAVPHLSLLMRSDAELCSDGSDMTKLFVARTRGMAFHFVVDCTTALLSADRRVPLAPAALESEMRLEHFQTRVLHDLETRDHRLPRTKALALANSVAHFVLLQRSTTLDAAAACFDESEVPDNQTLADLQWQQGSPVVQIAVTETEHAFQWGLRVLVAISSLVRPQRVQPDNKLDGPSVAATLQLCLFLPKCAYERDTPSNCDNHTSDDDETIDASIELLLMQPTSSIYSAATSATASYTDASEGVESQHAPSSTRSSSQLIRDVEHELPELLSVYVRGSFVSAGASAPLTDPSPAFVQLNLQTPFPRTRIVQAACSRFHALLLNDLGMAFAFGHSIDGALGLGSLHGLGAQDVVTAPRLLEFFFDQLITLRSVACGGDPMVGGHSAAVTTDGSVYTWGTGVALGTRSTRSYAEPQLIVFPRLEDTQADATNDVSRRIASVSCGGGFCVALAESGRAFAWGKWSDGRLGLGSIPILTQTSRKLGSRRQFQSFQLSPKPLVVASSHGTDVVNEHKLFAKVACGDAHCVALTLTGTLVTWGRGAHGQLGHGSSKDALSPAHVAVATEDDGDEPLAWRDVAAGENWSMALDALGRVWTWGACGGAVLGGGSGAASRTAVVTETILQHHYRLLKQQPSPSAVAPPPLPQLGWMRPQLVPCFGIDGVRVEKLSAGRQHACALSSDGGLYLWGDGPGLSSMPQLVYAAAATPTALGSEIVERVVCGGDLVIAFASGSFLARSLRALHRQCEQLSVEHESLTTTALHDATAELAVDVVLLVSGKRLFAHRLVLARRSHVLRDLIVGEQRTGAGTAVLELLLPQLRHDVAAVLLEFMYTDNVSRMLDPQSYLVRDVLRAALLYKLPTLAQRCRVLLDATNAPVTPLGPAAAASTSKSVITGGRDRSLAADLAFALGDPTWADLTLVAEGVEIPAHRCVLAARSEYFHALFAFDARRSSSSSNSVQSPPRHVVHVDEPYARMLRVLQFIYNDHIAHTDQTNNQQATDTETEPDADATEQLLEDLVAADKFGLTRFKRLCEHSVRLSLANCLDVLAVADLVGAAHLKQVALSFLQTRLRAVATEPAFERFQRDFPHLMDELLAHIRVDAANDAALRNWHSAVEKQRELQREQDAQDWDAKVARDGRFPWLHLVLAITFAALYLSVMSAHMHAHAFVPAMNALALLALFGALFIGWI